MKILLADDHAVLRAGLKQILALQFPDAEYGEAGSYDQVVELLRTPAWDVLVLDIFMPGRSGLDLLHELELVMPELPVLVLSSAPEEQMAKRVLQAGAEGYLNKQAAPEELAQAVKTVAAGGTYVSAKQAEALAGSLAFPRSNSHERLSGREFQVMQLVVAGRSNKEVAADLNLSIKTVSTFRTRILQKLGVQNDIELARYALEHKLVETPVLPAPAVRQ